MWALLLVALLCELHTTSIITGKQAKTASFQLKKKPGMA